MIEKLEHLGAKPEDYEFFLENNISTAVLFNYVKAALPFKPPSNSPTKRLVEQESLDNEFQRQLEMDDEEATEEQI